MENDLLTSDKEQLKMYFDSLEVNKVIEPAPIDDNEAEIEEYVDQIIADFTTGRGLGMLKSYEDRHTPQDYVTAYIWDVIKSFPELQKQEDKQHAIYWRFVRFLWGNDALTELVNDPDVSDIRCLSYYNIRYKKLGKRYKADTQFFSKEHYERFIKRLASRNKISLSDQNAAQDFTDPSSNPDYIFRYNISTKLVNDSGEFILHIRKINKKKKDIFALIKDGMLTEGQAAYLIQAVRDKKSLIVCGKGGSGKTTLLNALIEFISAQTSILCIQENQELFTETHPEFVGQHVVTGRGEEKIKYELKDLARNALTADIDLFIIGEVKGEEARYIFTATSTGAQFMITIHSEDAEHAIAKAGDYIKYNSDYTLDETTKMLSDSTDLVVFLDGYKLKEIVQIKGYDNENKTTIYERIV